ncbi:anti-sigma factor [Halopseudomonas sp.]|uniref:anti-sigma factor family protein n=1 Tax=Halopseudomonas sp. TaxID=2901191 RepID=UPI00356542A1
MNITDETLSAYLDAELPDEEMQAVSEALQVDPELSDRLADLAQVDRHLYSHYAVIDDHPLPEELIALLAQSGKDRGASPQSSTESDRVLPFSKSARKQRSSVKYPGFAVAAALLMAIGLFQLMGSESENSWADVAALLESVPSGAAYSLNDGRLLTPRLTFINQQGEYCRQYQLLGTGQDVETIACRSGESWERVATVEVETVSTAGGYETASGGSVLDAELDRMMSGPALTLLQEHQALTVGWSEK